jgi:hypothetical protein
VPNTHGLASAPPPARVAAYLRRVASLPTQELRQVADRWRGEALGHFAQDILGHREKDAPRHRDIGGPVMLGPRCQ